MQVLVPFIKCEVSKVLHWCLPVTHFGIFADFGLSITHLIIRQQDTFIFSNFASQVNVSWF